MRLLHLLSSARTRGRESLRARGRRLCVPGCAATGRNFVGKIAQYEEIYRLCFLRGPEGIIIGLSEQLD